MMLFIILFIIEKAKPEIICAKAHEKIDYDLILKKIEKDKPKFEEENKIKIKTSSYLRDVLNISLEKFYDIELAFYYQIYLYYKNKIKKPKIEYVIFYNLMEEIKHGVGNFI